MEIFYFSCGGLTAIVAHVCYVYGAIYVVMAMEPYSNRWPSHDNKLMMIEWPSVSAHAVWFQVSDGIPIYTYNRESDSSEGRK